MKILALDVGTSSVKAAVLDAASATPVGPIARAAYDLDYPTPEAAEIPPDRLWNAVTSAARSATQFQEGIEGIGLSCLMPALVLLDSADRPLLPIWTHLDRRARPAARQVQADVGEEFLNTVGNRPLPGGISALCFRQQHHDDNYLTHKVKHYLHANGWLALRMTGARFFDYGNACFTGLFNTTTDRKWSDRWCRYFEVERAWLPPVVCGSTTVGTLRSAVAGEFGLPAGLPVKLGTADTSSAMLAAGMKAGDLLHVVGTTQVLAAFTDRPRPDPRRLTRSLGVGETFIHVTHNPVGGVALNWVRDLCFSEIPDAEFFGRVVPEAIGTTTRVSLDPPFLGGDRLEIEAHRAAFRDLTLSTTRMDILVSVLQAMQLQHAKALHNLGMGNSFHRIILTGGGADLVRRLIPEYQGTAIDFLEEGSLRGTARLFLT